MNYRAEIDGLRAVAVLPVVLFHAGIEAFSGGFVGVDVFFVISGYLITSIILSEKAAGTFSLVNFYERRARRILPALFLVVAACIPIAWLWLPAYELASFSNSVIAVVLFVSNIFFWLDGGYFATANEVKPLLHTWSLAVEEQYYLLFPLFIMLAWRLGRRWMMTLLALAALASFALAHWALSRSPAATFFLLPTRGWELAIGALLAFSAGRDRLRDLGGNTRQLLSSLGLLMIGGAVIAYDKSTPFPGLAALLPTVGTALVIAFATPATWAGRLLASKPLVGVGLISYSAYLWHQPLLAFARIRYSHLTNIEILALILAVFVLAAATWRWVELPARQRGRFSRRAIFSWSGAGSVAFLLLGSTAAVAFSPSRFGGEAQLAMALTQYPAVFATNMDERKFVRHRIDVETLDPAVLVVGSSRHMQIAQRMSTLNLLNLSVSAASVEDDVAIAGRALRKFKPAIILVGADPWLFNADSGQTRWHSIAQDYVAALAEISPTDVPRQPPAPLQHDDVVSRLLSPVAALYGTVNMARLGANDDLPSFFQAKIRRDGSRVSDTASALTEAGIVGGFDELLDYAIQPYRPSPQLKQEFEKFLDYLASKHRVALVLSPYHPRLYERIQRERPLIVAMEREFRDLARSRQIEVLGSYDPNLVGCNDSDFTDGMHPTAQCMERIVRAYLLN